MNNYKGMVHLAMHSGVSMAIPNRGFHYRTDSLGIMAIIFKNRNKTEYAITLDVVWCISCC